MAYLQTILFIESGEAGGGSFESLVSLAGSLNLERWRPIAVFLNHTKHVERLRGMGVEVFLLKDRCYSRCVPQPFRKNLGRANLALGAISGQAQVSFLRWLHGPLVEALADLCRDRAASLIYLNDQINRDFFGVFLGRRTGLPLISHLRSMHGRGMSAHKATLANQSVFRYVANSEATADYWLRLGLDPHKVEVIPNAVPPLEGPDMDPRPKFALEPGCRVIGCVGRLIELKGHDFLIRAFARLLNRNPACILLIVGDGPEQARLQALTAELGIERRVIFPGRREDARQLMGGMDLLVLPSRYEGSGRVLLEAMSRATPVIGTDLYGIKEIIEHGKDGYLVPYKDEARLAELMQRILDDEALAESMGKAGQEKVNRDYTVEAHVTRIEAVMSEALA